MQGAGQTHLVILIEKKIELRHMPKYLIVKIKIEKDKKQLLTRVVGQMPFTIVVNMGIRSLINDNASSILGICI